jgi:phospholipid/cholesterol/gamma-HCH transport system substrate-binding protein
MNDTRRNLSVGLFVIVGLALAAVLMIAFSRGKLFAGGTYTLTLKAVNVGGIKTKAQVQMAGVVVGHVNSVELAGDGRSVFIQIGIENRYRIHGDAAFGIDASGFLGDQFVSIKPTANEKPLLQDGGAVTCEEPFNLQDTAKAASGFIKRLDATATRLNDAITRVDEMVLNRETLTNVAVIFQNLRTVSERAIVTMDNIDGVIRTNRDPIALAITNLVTFSAELNRVVGRLDPVIGRLDSVVATNAAAINATMTNLQATSAQLREIVTGVQQGQGTIGGLLKDPALKDQLGKVAANMVTLSSNLTRYGLLYKPPEARVVQTTGSFNYPPKSIR